MYAKKDKHTSKQPSKKHLRTRNPKRQATQKGGDPSWSPCSSCSQPGCSPKLLVRVAGRGIWIIRRSCVNRHKDGWVTYIPYVSEPWEQVPSGLRIDELRGFESFNLKGQFVEEFGWFTPNVDNFVAFLDAVADTFGVDERILKYGREFTTALLEVEMSYGNSKNAAAVTSR
jgi:hypothetical protein